MKIKDILLSIIIITNIIIAGPKDRENKSIGYGNILLEMLNHSNDEANRLANIYIRGVATGLNYNRHMVELLADMNPDFKKIVKENSFIQLPKTKDWLEISDVVYQYLINHPGDLHWPSVMLIEYSLMEVYGGIKDE